MGSGIEMLGRRWTYAKEILAIFSMAMKIVQLDLVISDAIVLMMGHEEIETIDGVMSTNLTCSWMLLFSYTCLGIIIRKGNDMIMLMGMYSPLLIVFGVIFCWNQAMQSVKKPESKQNECSKRRKG